MPGNAGAIRAGRAFVELFADDSKLKKGLLSASNRLDAFGKKAGDIGLKLGAAGAAMSAPLLMAVQDAAKASEAMAKFQAVFGGATDDAAKRAEDMAARVGRSAAELRGSFSTFQSFLVGGGFERGQALDLTEKLEGLALDLAAFHDIADDDARGRLVAALSGSSEVVDRFGINLKVAALNQELLNQGFEGGALKATEYQKTLARIDLIQRALQEQGAIGSAERESSSYTNRIKRLQGQLKDLSVTIGSELLPTAEAWLGKMSDGAAATIDWVKENKDLVGTYAKVAAGLLATSGAVLGVSVAVRAAAFSITSFVTAGKALSTAYTFATAKLTVFKTALYTGTVQMKAMQAASLAAKAALAGLVAVGVYKLTSELTGAAEAMRQLNRETEKSVRLMSQLERRAEWRHQDRRQQIAGLDDQSERRKQLTAEIDREQKSFEGLTLSVQQQEKQVTDAQTKAIADAPQIGIGQAQPMSLRPVIDLLFGESEVVKQERAQLVSLQEQREASRNRLSELQRDLAGLKKQPTPSAQTQVDMRSRATQVIDALTPAALTPLVTALPIDAIVASVTAAAPQVLNAIPQPENAPLAVMQNSLNRMFAAQAEALEIRKSNLQPLREAVEGTFSGVALNRMSARGPIKAMESTAKHTKDAAESLAEINQKLSGGTLVYAMG